MKYEIKLATLEKKLPDPLGCRKSFDEFVEHCRAAQRGDLGWFAIKHSSAKALLGFDPKESLVPFLALPDGGLIAFWFGPKRTVAIASLSHDGDAKLVGASWTDFLARWSAKKLKVPDLDDRELSSFPKFKGVTKKLTPLQTKQREFKKWLKSNAPEEPQVSEDTSEKIRKTLFRHFKKHLKNPKGGYFYSRSIAVTCTSRSYKVDWYCFPPRPYEESDRLEPVMRDLVQLLGRSLKKSEISITNDGCVFVEGNICLGDRKLYSVLD